MAPQTSGDTTVNSGIDTATPTPAPLATLAPNNNPTPGPTPIGTQIGTYPVSGGPKAIAFLANTLAPWLVRTSDIVQLDNNQQLGTPYAFTQPSLIAADGSSDLWVVSAGTLSHLNNSGFEGMSLAAAYSIGANANGIAVDGTEVWVSHSSGTLTRLTKSNGATVSFNVTSPTAIALDSTSAWVTGSTNSLYQVNRSTGALTNTYTVGNGPIKVVVDSSGNVWTANQTGQSLSRLASGGNTPTTIALSGAPSVLAADTSRIWAGLSQKVAWFGLDGTAQGSASLPINPTAMGIDAMGKVWFTDSVGNSVMAIQGR